MDDFEYDRVALVKLAQRIVGDAAEAEDVVQESWLRWHRVDTSTLDNPRAYLHRLVTHQAIDQLRRVRSRPETVALPEDLAGPDSDGALAEAVSAGMLLLLETLDPVERTVFLLHEVFGYSHAEIAPVVARTERAVRQLAYRARGRVRSRQSRYRPTPAEHRVSTLRFLLATDSGQLLSYADSCGAGTGGRSPTVGGGAESR
ncbi:sigma-70 family RNA polymerase sigma factor [Nocardia bovistercoris]|uniref:Sigma-70 family RNA polymerase sigma factor n=1 Tax=Nocardia bovistercoris TaxID=2785916 RepID=A0A931IJK1_9NOCA|nr:sigma-70 family RNA polymerase sigma factor [Nocardia bovistercoris]MBH0780850.1 sigma-70 family RNA polymerase sigma factor [Nocardia bovistercoris]